MKDNVPQIFWTFRTAWTLLHVLIVVAATAVLLWWALADRHAVRIFDPAKDHVLNVQHRVSNAIPWPWKAGSQDDDGDHSQSIPSPQEGVNAPPREYRVLGDVRVRVAPRITSRVVRTLADGTRIRIDCTIRGSAVDPGPYRTRVSAYRGVDNPGTTLWNHIPGLGYVSDAYVGTGSDSAVVPRCKK